MSLVKVIGKVQTGVGYSKQFSDLLLGDFCNFKRKKKLLWNCVVLATCKAILRERNKRIFYNMAVPSCQEGSFGKRLNLGCIMAKGTKRIKKFIFF